jgi:uncharacterized protein (TIGR00299 family) protein
MGKTLYLECNSGISGDMTVAALLDLGADEKVLKESLESLHLDGYQINIKRAKKCGIDACDFDVILEEDVKNNPIQGDNKSSDNKHSHEHIHSHEEQEDNIQEHSHSHDHDHNHDHDHKRDQVDNSNKQYHHSHEHRNLKDVYDIIDRLNDEDVKNMAKNIFNIVAKAEAKAHGIPVEEVHFHEVGAVDSIVDIVAVAVCIKDLGITDVIVSPLAEGSGTVRCQHGIIPVPVPAVLNIAIMNELILKSTDNKGEMITPTGAAIAAALRTKNELPKFYTIKNIGIGAGKKDFANANILRAYLIEEQAQSTMNDSEEKVWKLESNIDDCSGEALGYTMEKLIEAGARDVFYTPIFMKKNRPAYLLSIICKEKDISQLENIIFTHTTTIGIRRIAYERTILDREIINIQTSLGPAKVKLCKRGQNVLCYPEYESVREICEKEDMEFQQVYAFIINEYYQMNRKR